MTPIEHVQQVLNNQARIAKGAGNAYELYLWEELIKDITDYDKWFTETHTRLYGARPGPWVL